MQSLFKQASNYLRLRHAEIERRIEFSEDVGDNGYNHDQGQDRQGCSCPRHRRLSLPTPSNARDNDGDNFYDPLIDDKGGGGGGDGHECKEEQDENYRLNDPIIGGLSRMTLEDSFNWKEFQQLYSHSDLFLWHREAYLGDDVILDLEKMKRIWVENEERYEESFIEGAKKRLFQDGPKNAKKTRHKRG
ncbi:hypothetical protein BGZ65_003374 [Modicella reniformis]|uniref:Uncharacterized protein n=1 Tax=Modicella reniformis TaxID=1440133 RepID=A0A9P6SQ44_9FUNG|nr:hypothetical protein BGZ65_003374 [Modicella reniformis]